MASPYAVVSPFFCGRQCRASWKTRLEYRINADLFCIDITCDPPAPHAGRRAVANHGGLQRCLFSSQ